MKLPSIGTAAVLLCAAGGLAAPVVSEDARPGWTHKEFLDFLNLEITDGWPGMSKVTYYNVTQMGEEIDFSQGNLLKRSGDNFFAGYTYDNCNSNSLVFKANNFGCGVCVSNGGLLAASGYLWQQGAGNPYPTADWFTSANCQGSREFHQGIAGSGLSSCCNADSWNTNEFASAMLYQGC